jgi:hypothetical protein
MYTPGDTFTKENGRRQHSYGLVPVCYVLHRPSTRRGHTPPPVVLPMRQTAPARRRTMRFALPFGGRDVTIGVKRLRAGTMDPFRPDFWVGGHRYRIRR